MSETAVPAGTGGYLLYGYRGWGSVLVEAMLARAGQPYRMIAVDMTNPAAIDATLRPVNPLGQIPTLVLPDGRVMTESAAIALHLAECYPAAGLAPPPGSAERVPFLRWLLFLIGAVYPTFTYGDDPARWVEGEAVGKQLRTSTDNYRERLWKQVESGLGTGPWFLGGRFSALDIYVAAMTRWRPRRPWFATHCPKLTAIADRVDADPVLRPIWRQNFDM